MLKIGKFFKPPRIEEHRTLFVINQPKWKRYQEDHRELLELQKGIRESWDLHNVQKHCHEGKLWIIQLKKAQKN